MAHMIGVGVSIAAAARAARERNYEADCTVFAPPEIAAGEHFMVQVAVHTLAQAAGVEESAKKFDADAECRGYTSLAINVKHGDRLTVRLTMPGLAISQRLSLITWKGGPHFLTFQVLAPPSHHGGTVLGTVTVCDEQIPIGQITFKLSVRPKDSAQLSANRPTGEARSFETFFISYSSKDRPEVLKRVQMLARLGKKFYQDLLDIDAGERWEQKLYRRIDECDAVLLFWSSNAKASEWVLQECRYTIEKRGIDHLLPVIIEGPPPVPPPPELEALHMNDWLLYVMKAESETHLAANAPGQ
jgi:hypothetical protein